MSSANMNIFLFYLLASVFAGNSTRKVFIDNDGITPLNVFLPLLADMDILGLSASFGDPSYVDSLGRASDLVQNYTLGSCIPLYGGASTPLIRTEKTFNAWQSLYGEFVWKGAWDPKYNDTHLWDKIVYNSSTPAAWELVKAVKEYPNEVEIYAAGLMTTVAQAISLYPSLPQEAKALWIMGGYIDGQYDQVTGGDIVDDINTDFNLMIDPEAAHIVLTANWTDLYIGGNVTNYLFPTQELYDSLIHKFGKQSIDNEPNHVAIKNFIGNGNASSVFLPLWDEAVSAYMAFPELIQNYTEVRVSVDTSFNSPFYGNLRIWPSNLAPKAANIGKAKYINSVNKTGVIHKIYDAFGKDWTKYCSHGVRDL